MLRWLTALLPLGDVFCLQGLVLARRAASSLTFLVKGGVPECVPLGTLLDTRNLAAWLGLDGRVSPSLQAILPFLPHR